MTLSILLVEDEAIHYSLFKRHMERSELNALVTRVETGEKAIHVLTALPGVNYDVVVLDLNLPDMSGVRILEYIRGDANLSSLPVVILSTSNIAEEYNTCLRLGVKQFFEKPLSYSDFFKNLESLIKAGDIA